MCILIMFRELRLRTKILICGPFVLLQILTVVYIINHPIPPGPPSIKDLVLNQSIIGSSGDLIMGAIRKERQHLILQAQDHGINLTANGEFFRLFPPVFTCPFIEERLGGDLHGKWACGVRQLYAHWLLTIGQFKNLLLSPPPPPPRPCVMYSFNVGPNTWYFDKAVVLMTNCKLFAYNPTTIKKNVPSKSSNLESLKQLMDFNGHDWIDILKVDVNGTEYDSLNTIMNKFAVEGGGVLPFDQLIVAFYVYPIHNLYVQILPMFNKLEDMGLRVVHAEKKSNCTCFEYNFVNVKGKVFRHSTFSFFKNGWTDASMYTGNPNIQLPFQVV